MAFMMFIAKLVRPFYVKAWVRVRGMPSSIFDIQYGRWHHTPISNTPEARSSAGRNKNKSYDVKRTVKWNASVAHSNEQCKRPM